MKNTRYDAEVLIAGAGPVGLALAGDLGWRGHSCVLVDMGDGVIGQPKMDMVGIRTMEFCRRWGLVQDVENAPYGRDYPQDNVYLTSLNGWEMGRQPMPSMNAAPYVPESPQRRERCPQNMFDPIMQKFAGAQPGVDIRYRHRMVSFVQDKDGVTSTLEDIATQKLSTLRTRYLVGCDGAKSAVREQLGIGMQGRGVLTHTTNIVFRCAEFNQLHDKAPGYRYMFVGRQGTWATIVAINGKDQWRMSIIGNAQERKRYTEEEIKVMACEALGRQFDPEILSILRWTRIEQVADRYRDGRVFMAGDAVHLTSPTGGLGMNTGIGDAVDLSWKLAAALEGWGGETLLDSYGIERKPVAHRITRFSTSNLQTMKQVPGADKVLDEGPEGDAARIAVGHALGEGLKREWFSQNMHMGYRYDNSPVCVFNEHEDPAALEAEREDAVNYVQTTRPGCRAPHAWLADGRSTLDLFGKGMVLVVTGGGSDFTKLQESAKSRRIPLTIERIEEPAVQALYQKPQVLVRPDGHVAWRGDNINDVADEVLSIVTGNAKEKATV